MINFFPNEHIASSSKRGFGVCDPPASEQKAYIANSAKPRFRSGQTVRMENFFAETNYILRIENTIEID